MKPAQLREAAALLKKRKLKKPRPATLVKASQELGLPLAETLAFIMRLRQAGQNQQAQRREILLAAAKAGQ